MVYIYKKVLEHRQYYYLRGSTRKGKRVITKDIAYLGSSRDEVITSLRKINQKDIRAAYRTIHRFLESDKFSEQAKQLKMKQCPFLSQEILVAVEACRLHWQHVVQMRDAKTKEENYKNFVIDFAFNTTSIEGNTITLKEATLLLKEQLTPKQKTLREVYDVQNTERVFLDTITTLPELTHESMQNMHANLMSNIDARMGYRTSEVHVIHARFVSTPSPYIKTDLDILLKWIEKNKNAVHPMAYASIFHHKFEKIHPFFDGNGRTGRLLLNLILLKAGYPPVIILKRNRVAYLEALRKADTTDLTKAHHSDYKKLVEFVAGELVETYWNLFL